LSDQQKPEREKRYEEATGGKKINFGVDDKVANAFDVSIKGKKYKTTIDQATQQLNTAVENFSKERLTEYQKLADAGNNIEELNEKLKAEVTQFATQRQSELNTDVDSAFQEFKKAFETIPEAKKDAGYWESFFKRAKNVFANQIPSILPSGREQQRPKNYDELASRYPSYPKKEAFDNPEEWKKFAESKYSESVDKTVGQDLRDTYEKYPEGGEDAYKMFAQKSEDRLRQRSRDDADEIEKQNKESEKLLSNVPIHRKDNGLIDLGYIGGQVGNAIGTSLTMMFSGSVGPLLLERQDAYEEGIRKAQEESGLTREEIVFSPINDQIGFAADNAGLINSVLERVSFGVVTAHLTFPFGIGDCVGFTCVLDSLE